MCHRQAIRRLAIGSIIFGMICLVGGACTTLVWAFMPDISKIYPVGLRIGALTCVFGVAFTLSGLISLFCWQTKLERLANRFRSTAFNHQDVRPLNDVYELPSSESITLHNEELFGTLKKAKSIAYMSLSPVQSESVKLLSVLHGTISATHLDHLLLRSGASTASGVRQARRVHLSGESNPQSSFVNIRQSLLRDKSMRRSLPRVLIHRHNSKIVKNGGNHAGTRVTPLAKARSEGLDLDTLNQQNQSGASQSSECDTDVKLKPAPDTNGLPGPMQQPVTPPAGQASLFTLNNHLTLSDCNVPSTDAVSNSTHCQVESGTSLEQTALNKRYLLMNQSGQVISCTTLFDGEEADVDTSGVGCRHLQKCTAWNFFPLFVGHERSDKYALSDEERGVEQHDPETSSSVHAVRSLHPGPEDSQSDPPDGKKIIDVKLLNRLRRFLCHRIQIRRATGSRRKRKTGCIVVADIHPNISTYSSHTRQQRRQMPRLRKRIGTTKVIPDNSTPDCQSLSEEPCRPSETSQSDTGDTLDDTRSSGNLQIDRKHTIVSNASVFSLPAIPPEMWTVEQPVWIMGVPMSTDQRWVAMDACDLIVLRKNDDDRAGSVDSMKPVTGSHSSMFAFHVKPPSRLKPAACAGARSTQHVRARSLGRIRVSEKYLAP